MAPGKLKLLAWCAFEPCTVFPLHGFRTCFRVRNNLANLFLGPLLSASLHGGEHSRKAETLSTLFVLYSQNLGLAPNMYLLNDCLRYQVDIRQESRYWKVRETRNSGSLISWEAVASNISLFSSRHSQMPFFWPNLDRLQSVNFGSWKN